MFTIGEWAILYGSILVLMIWSYMWRGDQPIYYTATAICVGGTMGHFLVQAVQALYEIAYLKVLAEAWVIIPIIFGVMLFLRFRRGFAWLATTAISVIVGTSLGLLVRGGLTVQILGQVTLIMGLQFIGVDSLTVFSNLVILFGFLAVITYFLFSKSLADLAPVQALSNFGRILMLGMSGVSFATGYAFRITMALNALQPFNTTWPGQLALPIVAAAMIIYFLWERSKK